MEKTTRVFIAFQLVLVLLLLSIFVISLRVAKPNNYIKGQTGDTGMVDYEKVNKLIEQKVNSIPIPTNGINGLNGKDGKNGVDGQSIVGPQGPAGESGPKGEQGDIGSPGLQTEFRTNPNSGNLEYRYIGDDSWTTLMKQCQITNSCI